MSGSRWWFGVAAYPLSGILIWTIGLSLTITETIPILFGLSGLTIYGLFWTGGIMGLFTPVFLYLDAKSLQNTDWAPKPFVYFSIGLFGVFIPPLMLGVTLRYLYLRYRNVGLSIDSTNSSKSI